MQFENAIPARTKGLLGACLFLRFYLGLAVETTLHLQPLRPMAMINRLLFSPDEKVKRIAIPRLLLASKKTKALTPTCDTQ